MSVTENDLIEIDKVLSTPNSDAQVVTELRRRFPHLTWTQCDASDVIEAPFRSYTGFDLHLLDSADHCSQITRDPTRASGFVLGRRSAVA
ncbi:MAG: hypothetical protein WAM77_00075 [Xanthobacteraceae bacterium]|jgi:hypothetical protein